MYEMKDEYYIGIDLIDEEHKELFRIAQSAYDVYQDPFIPDKYDHIVTIIEELKNYAKKHFADEEEYMKSINYKKMFTQKIEHDAFIKKLEKINLDEIDVNQGKALLEILEFLNNWLVNHIMNNDKLIGQ